jgi:hypothetical protein
MFICLYEKKYDAWENIYFVSLKADSPNTSKQYLLARQTVFRFTIVKLDDVKQLTLNILLNVYLFGNAEVMLKPQYRNMCT